MKVHELLFEATFDVDEVVDFIYNDVYAEFINNVQKYMNGEKTSPEDLNIVNKIYTWQDLVNNIDNHDIRNAFVVSKVETHAGVFESGNGYKPLNKTIILSFNLDLYNMLYRATSNGYSFEDMMAEIPEKHHTTIQSELNGDKIKGSIAHEFAHFLGDIYHDKHLTKLMQKVKRAYDKDASGKILKKLVNRNKFDTYQTDYEIDAMIHALQQIKRSKGETWWDTLTFDDMIKIDPSVYAVVNRLRNTEGEAAKFMKSFIKRMNREGLIGKRMTGNMKL